MKKAHAALLPLLLAPAVALAFETVDTLPWPSDGRFPAYPAEGIRPWTIWAQAGLRRDSNILRTESAREGDTIMRAGIGGRMEQRIVGRQRVRLDARADYYAFETFDQLDHLAYSVAGDWLWEVGNDLSGTLGVGRERRLGDLGESQSSVRNLLTVTRLYGTAAYLVTPSLRLRGGAATGSSDSELRAETETRGTSASAGIDWVSPLGNAIGVEYRTSYGDAPVPELVAPVGTFVNNDYREHEVALVVGYSLGETLRAGGRLGRTKRTYTEIPGRDFKGTTGRADLEWLPGNKTRLTFAAYKEPRSILEVAASHTVVKGVSFGPSWAATAKLVFSALLTRERRTFEGDPALAIVPGTPVRDEQIDAWRFGVGWEPARQWQIGFSLERGERESNFAGRDYQYTAATINAAWRY